MRRGLQRKIINAHVIDTEPLDLSLCIIIKFEVYIKFLLVFFSSQNRIGNLLSCVVSRQLGIRLNLESSERFSKICFHGYSDYLSYRLINTAFSADLL